MAEDKSIAHCKVISQFFRLFFNHFINAGYPSLARLAQADIAKLTADVLKYGQSIGKNLKFGVEADSGGIIARLLPRVIED